MDFISGIPHSEKGHDSIWVIIDRLTKFAHFIPVGIDYRPHQYAQIYVNQIACLHGVPRTIISDRGP
jgi:hypothetical protein